MCSMLCPWYWKSANHVQPGCCPWCWKPNYCILVCRPWQKTLAQPMLTLALCSTGSLGRVITEVIAWAYSRPWSQAMTEPANRCLSRCCLPFTSLVQPVVRLLGRSSVKMLGGGSVEHKLFSWNIVLAFVLFGNKRMYAVWVNQYSKQQMSEYFHYYVVFLSCFSGILYSDWSVPLSDPHWWVHFVTLIYLKLILLFLAFSEHVILFQ